jgi:hypothetical protein
MSKKHGYHPKAQLLEDLRKTNPRKSDEEIKEEMDRMGYEPFHIAFGRNVSKIAFRKKRVR